MTNNIMASTPETIPGSSPHEHASQQINLPLGAGFDFSDPKSPLAPFYLQKSHIIAVVVMGAFFILLNYLPLWHTDTWGHVAYGRYIVQHYALPDGNLFCPFQKGHVAANNYCWLTQASFYGVYSFGAWLAGSDPLVSMAGGVNMLRLTHALIVVARLTFLLLAFYRLTQSFRLSIAGLVVFLVINFGGSMYIFRPQTVGELCFAILLFSLSRRPASHGSLIGIPLLMVLWGNLHGSYAVGLAFLGLWWAGAALTTSWHERSIHPKRLFHDLTLRRLTIVFVGAIVGVGLLNPAGPMIFWNTINMANHPVVLKMDEWTPMVLKWEWGGHYNYFASLLFLVGAAIYARGRIAPAVVLITLFFAVQPFQHQRTLTWWLNMVPWLCLCVMAGGPALAKIQWFRSQSIPSFRKTLFVTAIIVLCFMWSNLGLWCYDGKPFPLRHSVSSGTSWQFAYQLQGVHEGTTPWSPRLDAWLHKHYSQGRFQGGIFTTEMCGDYLVWALPEQMPVFMYAHVHLFNEHHWNQVATVRCADKGWRDILDRHKINLLVVETELHKKLRAELQKDPNWQIVHDEHGQTETGDYRFRRLIAARKNPL